MIELKLSTQHAHQTDATYVKSRGLYKVPCNLGSLRELHRLGYDVLEQGLAYRNKRDTMLQQKETELQTDSPLRSYQKQDANFLLNIDSAGNFSQQRTGKSPTMCEVLTHRQKKTLLICPAGLVLNWIDELRRWTTLHAISSQTTLAKRRKAYQEFQEHVDPCVLVLSKETARNDVEHLLNLDYEIVLIDEAHFLRNYKSKQSSAMYRLGQRSMHNYALTGTPATNSPSDIYGILKFLYPKRFSSYWQFVERYFEVNDGFFGKTIGTFKTPERKEELREVVEEISVQRKRVDVMKWLPRKQYQTIKLEMDTKQGKAYRDMLTTFEVTDSDISAMGILAQLTRLRQITVAPSMLELDIPSVKEKFLLEWLEDNADAQVVIFSNFSSYLTELAKKIKGASLIVGSVTKPERQKVVQDFQEGKSRIILANIEAAGVGLTLDKADAVIFLDRHYTVTSNLQAEDRIVATSEDSNLSATVIDLVCVGTIDEQIIEMVRKKEDITKIINDYNSFNKFIGV